MSTEIVLLVLIGCLALAGAVVGVILAVRRDGSGASPIEANPMQARVSAEVHAGEEQVLIHLARTLTLPSGSDEVGYGEIYLAASAGTTMKIASRSEIGRGFDGEVRVHRTRRASVAEYYILRMPGDESLHARIAALDDRIADALITLDPQAHVRRPSG